MKTRSKETCVLGLHLAFYGNNPTVTEIDPGRAADEAMTKGYLLVRLLHSLMLDHLDAWWCWSQELAKGEAKNEALCFSYYGRKQRIEGNSGATAWTPSPGSRPAPTCTCSALSW